MPRGIVFILLSILWEIIVVSRTKGGRQNSIKAKRYLKNGRQYSIELKTHNKIIKNTKI